MVNIITEGEVAQLLTDHRVSVRQKGEWQVWWHRAVQLFFFVVGIFKPDLKMAFYTRYTTAIGRTIYLVDLESYKSSPQNYQAVILHELDHIREYDERGVMFFIRYLLFPSWRAYFEYKAYCHQLIHFYNRYGSISPEVIASIVVQFSENSIYQLDEPHAEMIINELAFAVTKGLIYGKYATGFEDVWTAYMKRWNSERSGYPRSK